MASNDQTKPQAATPAYLTAQASVLCIGGAPRVLKATAGTVVSVSVQAGGATGAIYDCATTGATVPNGNQVGVIPSAQGVYQFDFPCLVGIVVVPGANTIISIAYT